MGSLQAGSVACSRPPVRPALSARVWMGGRDHCLGPPEPSLFTQRCPLCITQRRWSPLASPLRSGVAPVLMWTVYHVPCLGWSCGCTVGHLLPGSPLLALAFQCPLLCHLVAVVGQVRAPQPSTPVSQFSQLAFGHTMVAFAVTSDLSHNEQGTGVSHRERCTLQARMLPIRISLCQPPGACHLFSL